MKLTFGLCAGLLALAIVSKSIASPVQVFYTDNSLEQEIASDPVQHSTTQPVPDSVSMAAISVDTTRRFQTVSGVGAAFSEIGTLALLALDDNPRAALLRQLFDPQAGAGFSMCRFPVGSSDFAVSAYSYDDSPGDYDMQNFDLSRDEKSLLPAARAALKLNPKLRFFASPWSPPGWMKVTGQMDHGGKDNYLIDDDRTYKAYALYLQKYLQGYTAEGAPIERLCPQNEMDYSPHYPGCLFPPDRFVKFITRYLAPRLKSAHVSTEIWAGTFRESQKVPFAAECMKDDAFRACIAGLGIQYFQARAVDALAQQYPGTRFMFTEAVCNGGKNTAKEARARFGEIANAFNSGCDNYAYWNMILDEHGKSGWNWAQNSLVTINRITHEVRYNPDYQPVYLLSKFVQRGDVRVTARGQGINGNKFTSPLIAFVKPDGTVTILAQNISDAPLPIDLTIDQTLTRIDLPPHSDCAIENAAATK